MTASLEITDVTVHFGGLVALDGVSAMVEPHQVVGVIGPNGAGKTTLFNVICGFVRPAEGSLRWQGRQLHRHRPHQLASLGIARTLQGLGLFPHCTVLDNVVIGADRHARAGVLSGLLASPTSDADERQLRLRAEAVLADLGIGDTAGRLPSQLPYGVQKRVALARALVADPALLLLDEPASGLSADEIRELADLIRGLTDRMSVLLVEHHMDLVMDVCDHIVVLDFGRVIAAGGPEAVRGDARVLEAYLGEEIDERTQAVGGEAGDASG